MCSTQSKANKRQRKKNSNEEWNKLISTSVATSSTNCSIEPVVGACVCGQFFPFLSSRCRCCCNQFISYVFFFSSFVQCLSTALSLSFDCVATRCNRMVAWQQHHNNNGLQIQLYGWFECVQYGLCDAMVFDFVLQSIKTSLFESIHEFCCTFENYIQKVVMVREQRTNWQYIIICNVIDRRVANESIYIICVRCVWVCLSVCV